MDDNQRHTSPQGESITLKYNPLHKDNAIPKRLRFVVLSGILIAFGVRVIAFLMNLCGRN